MPRANNKDKQPESAVPQVAPPITVPAPPPRLGDTYTPREDGLDFEAAVRPYPGYRITRVAEHNLHRADTEDPNRVRVKKGSNYILNEDICTDDGHGNLKYKGMWLFVETVEHYNQRILARAQRCMAKMAAITQTMLQHNRPDEIEFTGQPRLSLHNIGMAMQMDPTSAQPTVQPATVPTVPSAPSSLQTILRQTSPEQLQAALQQLYGQQQAGPFSVEADDGSPEPGEASAPADAAGPVLGQGVTATQHPGSEGGENQ
jgi:hypothetical protein